MNRVVMFSGGIASWATAHRVIERHGRDDVTLLFTDTKTEDEDLYRFLEDAEKDLGIPVTRLSDGRDIWQVFKDEKFLGNTRVDLCSRILKRDLSRDWLKEHCDPADTVIYLGMDWSEGHRLERSQKAWLPWVVEGPMTEPPYRSRDEMSADLAARGIKRPRLYDMGMSHNNCGGGCVKAGQSHFIQLLHAFPERYAEWEANEEGVRQHIGANVSILRDRTGGATKPMTLKTLRLRSHGGINIPTDEIGGCACFEEPEGEADDDSLEGRARTDAAPGAAGTLQD